MVNTLNRVLCIMSVKLSAVIITFNEERNIRRCIESILDVVDEIVVVDSYSVDKTKDICSEYDVRFIEHEFEGHIEQKNWAKDQATFDYILSLDADEALDEKLKSSINTVKQDWTNDGYSMNRLTNYCGHWVRHSGWYPDVKMRLFHRKKGNWGGNNPHDKFILDKSAKQAHLSGDLLHYSYYSRAEHLQQIHKFSDIGAKALAKKGKRSSYLKILIKPLARFIKAYLVNLGFLDGKVGFDIARFSAYSNYLKYSKLMTINRTKGD